MKGEKPRQAVSAKKHQLAGDREVRLWRRDRLSAMGFALPDARAIADSPADLANVRALIARGCPHETVRRIVL